jgi:hypothetical protein
LNDQMIRENFILFSEKVKLETYPKFLKSIKTLIKTRFLPLNNKFQLWKDALDLLKISSKNTLPIYESMETKDDENIKLVWKLLYEAIYDFYFYKDTKENYFAEEEESNTLKFIETEVFGHSKTCPEEILKLFITLICKLNSKLPHKISNESLVFSFKLLNNIEKDNNLFKISVLSFKIVFEKIVSILNQYIKDSLKSKIPLQKYRKDEILEIFTQIEKLEINQDIFSDDVNKYHKEGAHPSVYGKNAFLIRLFPTLSEFVILNDDDDLKKFLNTLLIIIYTQFGL